LQRTHAFKVLDLFGDLEICEHHRQFKAKHFSNQRRPITEIKKVLFAAVKLIVLCFVKIPISNGNP